MVEIRWKNCLSLKFKGLSGTAKCRFPFYFFQFFQYFNREKLITSIHTSKFLIQSQILNYFYSKSTSEINTHYNYFKNFSTQQLWIIITSDSRLKPCLPIQHNLMLEMPKHIRSNWQKFKKQKLRPKSFFFNISLLSENKRYLRTSGTNSSDVAV